MLAEDNLEPAKKPDRETVIEYLEGGGLVAILRANLGGGKTQPSVWLTYTSQGGITHTFVAKRGVVGGATIPFFALFQDKVFAGKVDEVIAFVESFGLSRQAAKAVVEAVGVGP